jgi:hypothetical protein
MESPSISLQAAAGRSWCNQGHVQLQASRPQVAPRPSPHHALCIRMATPTCGGTCASMQATHINGHSKLPPSATIHVCSRRSCRPLQGTITICVQRAAKQRSRFKTEVPQPYIHCTTLLREVQIHRTTLLRNVQQGMPICPTNVSQNLSARLHQNSARNSGRASKETANNFIHRVLATSCVRMARNPGRTAR